VHNPCIIFASFGGLSLLVVPSDPIESLYEHGCSYSLSRKRFLVILALIELETQNIMETQIFHHAKI
jgi:hypothetical protein